MSESDYLRHLKKVSSSLNKVFKTYIGLGYNRSYMPAVIQRNILRKSRLVYSLYTPYQAEIAQGRIGSSFKFSDNDFRLNRNGTMQMPHYLTKSTAAAEAMSLLFSYKNKKIRKKDNAVTHFWFLTDTFFHKHLCTCWKSRSIPLGIKLEISESSKNDNINLDNSFFGAFFQYPGLAVVIVDDIEPIIEAL